MSIFASYSILVKKKVHLTCPGRPAAHEVQSPSAEHPYPTHPQRGLDGRLRRRRTCRLCLRKRALLGAYADGVCESCWLGVAVAHLLLFAETAGAVQSKAKGNANPGFAKAESPGERRFACV